MSKPTFITRLALASILLLSLALLPPTDPVRAAPTTNVLRNANLTTLDDNETNQPGLYGPGAYRSSAHDPAIVGLSLENGMRPRAYLPMVGNCHSPLDLPFTDDFMDNQDKGWTPVVGSWEIANQEYRLRSRQGEDEYSFIGNKCWSNYTIKADLMYTDGALTNDFGIAFNVSEDDNSLYKLVINGDDHVRLLYVSDRERDIRRVIDLATSPVSFQPGEWYTLQAVIRDGRIQCSIDGQVVIDVQDSSRTAGLVGLMSDGFRALLHYDNVKVY